MSKSQSGTASFGSYVARTVIPEAIARYEGCLADSNQTNRADEQDLMALAGVTAQFLSYTALFGNKPNCDEYIDSFSSSLLTQLVIQGLDYGRYLKWHGRIQSEIVDHALLPANQTILKVLHSALAPEYPLTSENPAAILFGHIGAIFSVAAKKGEFTLP